MADPHRVAFRFDADTSLGGGHAVRCLALADALADRGAEVLLLANPGARDMLPAAERRHAWRDVAGDGAAALEALFSVWRGGADLAVVDHYGWSARDERLLRPAVRRLAVIDDLANRAHDCDLLVDQNSGRCVQDYAGLLGPSVPLMVGPRYALVRPAFAGLRAAAWSRRMGVPAFSGHAQPRVLLSFGLSDPGGIALRTCVALAQLAMPAVFDVVVSPRATSFHALGALAARDPRFVLAGGLDAQGMAERMLAADLAIGGGGGTAWERCVLGLPSLLCVLADNQRAGAVALAAAGAGRVFEADAAGVAALVAALEQMLQSPDGMTAMARAAFDVADGRGCQRVAAACGDLMDGLTLSVAGPQDGERVWRWRNAPAARAASRVPDEIPLEGHLAWYDRAIADPRRVILIGHAGTGPFGMVRFDETGEGTWEVSIALDPARTGRGLGTRLLRRACAWIEADRPVRSLVASARETNAASLRAFASCGFRLGDPREGWVAMTAERGLHGTA